MPSLVQMLYVVVAVLAELCPDPRLRVILVILREVLAIWRTS